MEVAVEGERGATLDGTSITVQKVKESIAKKDPSIPSDRQRLIFKGRILDNDRSLSDYDIVKGATLFLVKSAAPSTSAPAPAAASAAPAPYSATAANPNPNNSRGNAAGQPQMPPFMNPFGMPNAGGSGQQMPNPSPEQMQQMMNSPMMQGLLDNPDLLGSILEQQMHSNPQLQRLMEQNPELRQVYSDPAMLRQAAEMMRNPSHMQSMMRQVSKKLFSLF